MTPTERQTGTAPRQKTMLEYRQPNSEETDAVLDLQQFKLDQDLAQFMSEDEEEDDDDVDVDEMDVDGADDEEMDKE